MTTADIDRIPVRRHSRLAGHCEGLFWRRTTRQDMRRIVLAARRYELVGRQKGNRSGPLGHVALEIVELLVHLVDYRSGRLEPSLTYLMERLRRSKDAIVRALKALREHGFIDWLRRYVPTNNTGKGPVVQQTSNAYRLSMPPVALRLLGRLGQPAPAPDDHSVAVEGRRDETSRMREGLPLAARALDLVEGSLGEALARLGRALQRESGKQTEPLSGLDSIGGASLPAGK
jgi:hypothetical protein